ncbi:MAG: hypothetical protein J6A75_00735 [Lachnospiraceae bacterium]|nr:hypothetical protein [Lachnospiraceae bacterium]
MKKVKFLVIGLICIGIVVGFYFYLSNGNSKNSETDLTEVQKVILKDLSGDGYPATPREVVKLYNRILCCYYNEEHTEEEFYQLADQAIALMDQELADNNPPEQYYLRVQQDIVSYRENKKTINNASVCDSNEVKFAKIEDAEYAYVGASYFIKENGTFVKSKQNYVLRQDEEGNWKILAFELVEGDTAENE